jgi:hypothetical protein
MTVPAQQLIEGTEQVLKEAVSVKSFILIIWLVVGLCNIKTSIKVKIIYSFSICSQHYATVTIKVMKLNAEFF